MWQLYWENVIKLKDIKEKFDFNGVYIHFLCGSKCKPRIIYVGTAPSRSVNQRNTDYKVLCKPVLPGKKLKYMSLNLRKLEGDIYEYITNGNLAKHFNKNFYIIPGNYQCEANQCDEVHRIRKDYFDKSYISAVNIDNIVKESTLSTKDICEYIESTIQKFLITKYKIDFYYRNFNFLGKVEKKSSLNIEILNNFPSKTLYWFNDLVTHNNIIKDTINYSNISY